MSLSKSSIQFLRGPVACALKDYELRLSQAEMMEACANAIEKDGTLMAEAGTGTGKTFAYLIPLILSGKRGIVSTRTKNLQEQLVSKDLGFLSKLKEFSYAIAKGRGNYLCSRRVNAFRPFDRGESEEYERLVRWADRTGTGDIEEYGLGSSLLWDEVHSDADACDGKKCTHYRRCFYYKARQKWESAQIVVANHALTGINAMLDEDAKILPEAGILIIDEAHALDQAVSEQVGITLSRRTFEIVLNRLLKLGDRGTYRGLLCNCPEFFSPVESLRSELEVFWLKVKTGGKHRQGIRGPFFLKDFMGSLASSIRSLIMGLRKSQLGLFSEDDEIELRAAVGKLQNLADGLEAFADQKEHFVRWAEIGENRISLRMAPIYPAEFVRNGILASYESAILTSATLSVAGDFEFIENILGLRGAESMSVPSPYDLRRQIAVEIRKGIALQSGNGVKELAAVIEEEASKKDGGILVLFTSRDVMRRTWECSSEALRNKGLQPMLQGEMPNRLMLDIMRQSANSVIFGLDSFWEGVDVKGDSLKCLVITKLPFEVPTEPIALARTEDIEKNGGNPFYDYSLPKAVLKFKQGFGRLIRSKSDTGRVVICDERIETKAYGRIFLESLFETPTFVKTEAV
jgi:ATP-dependent DNA helicase DinG